MIAHLVQTEKLISDPCEKNLNSSLDFKETFENLVNVTKNLTEFFEFVDYINTDQSPNVRKLLKNLAINPNKSIYSIEVNDKRKLRNIVLDYIFQELEHRIPSDIIFNKKRSEPLSLPGRILNFLDDSFLIFKS